MSYLITKSVGRVIVVHSFNAHQSNLRHLTWKTQQIADGDKKSSQMAHPLFDCSEPQLPPLEDYLYYDVEPPEVLSGEL